VHFSELDDRLAFMLDGFSLLEVAAEQSSYDEKRKSNF
jgi:hypothetical protein